MKKIQRISGVSGAALMLIILMAGIAAAQIPMVRVLVPNLTPDIYKRMPITFTVGVMGSDVDSPTLLPAKFRYLLASAQYDTNAQGDPLYILTAHDYDLYGEGLLPWDHSDWSEWQDYPTDGQYPEVDLVSLADGEFYLFAVQVMDADGAVSIDLDYQLEVFNFQATTGYYRPTVTICETYLGCHVATVWMNEIAAGQPLNFSWVADASPYGGTIVSYRHGWDLIDPNDPNDPGWAVPPGLEPQNLRTQERSFNEGLHTLYVRVEDNAAQVRLMSWQLRVIPFVSRDNQLELLFIDQVVDGDSQAWPDQAGNPRDNEVYRNAYWEFLAFVPGSVVGFHPERDRRDHREQVDYSDLVSYKAVLCNARTSVSQTMFQQFRPVDGTDKFVWLAPYQFRGGNYFQVGDNSMDSYLEISPDYMVPIIFPAPETTLIVGNTSYILGFGQKEMPDGSLVARGPEMYPYATAGITAIDWTSPNNKTIYGRSTTAKFDRDVDCVGLKGLVLDPDFRANHSVGLTAISDTFITDPTIDWHDVVDAGSGGLDLFANTFPFRNDEFVDMNISSRPTPVVPQDCSGIPEAPGGMCVEPMFTGVSRMDWMREEKWAGGDTGWPQSEYTSGELDAGCGPLGLTSYLGEPQSGSRTNGHTYGYLSYKMIEEKPINRADVYWGFDPYRFDQGETKKAIRWVLEYFGLMINP